MKTLKIIVVAIFSIGLLTAVLPSSEAEPTVETLNHEVKKANIDLIVMIDRTKIKEPTQG